jgi:hypothetical protein
MNNDKDKQPAAQRPQEKKDDRRYQCPFPKCGKLFWKEPGLPDCCPPHRQMILDVGFIMAHLRPITAKEAPKTEADAATALKPGEKVVTIPGVNAGGNVAKIINESAASLDEALRKNDAPPKVE